MGKQTAEDMADDLSSLLHEKLGVRGKELEAQLAHAGRLLPKRVRRQAAVVAEAKRFSGHPKLSQMTDQKMLTRAYSEVEDYLKKIDAAELRKTKIINFLGGLSFNLLAVLGLLVAFLVWKDFL